MTDFATLVLAADTRQMVGARQELDRVTAAGGKAEKSTQGLSRSFVALAARMAAAAAAAVSFRQAVQIIGDFDRSMGQLAAVTRATTRDLEAMRKTARDLGSTTEFTARQAADGMRFLGMAGFSAAESMAAIPAVLDLATAASMDLARAADISSNIMSAFGVEAGNAAQVADLLAAASSSANTDVSQLGEAMKFAGPVAQALGVSMGDTAAAIGVLSDAGIQGSMAGTSLRTIMSSLVNPSNQAAAALAGMGISLDEVNPRTVSLVEIMERLERGGLSAADAMTIFGQRGGPAILALTSQTDSLRRLTDSLTDVEGRAGEMAGIIRGDLRGAFDSMTSAAQGLIITLGEAGLTRVIMGSINALTAFIRFVDQGVRGLQLMGQHLGTFMGSQAGMERSIDAATDAMRQQIIASGALALDTLPAGARVSRDYALAQLELMEATLAAMEAQRLQNIERVKGSGPYIGAELEIMELQNIALQNQLETRRTLSQLGISPDMEEYAIAMEDANRFAAELESQIELIIAEQQSMLAEAAKVPEEFQRLVDTAHDLKRSIAEASGEVVTLKDKTKGAREEGESLSRVLGNLSMSTQPITVAGQLASQLQLATGAALGLRAALSFQNELGIPDARPRLGFGGQPSLPGATFGEGSGGAVTLGFGNVTSETAALNREVQRLTASAQDLASTMGGGGGGGGGGSSVADAALRGADAVRKTAEEIVAASNAMQQAMREEAFGDTIDMILGSFDRGFKGAFARIARGFGDMLKDMAMQAARQNIMGSMGMGPAGGGLGGILGGLGSFGGLGGLLGGFAGPLAIGMGLFSLFRGRRSSGGSSSGGNDQQRVADEAFRLETRRLELLGRTNEVIERQLLGYHESNRAAARHIMNLERRAEREAEIEQIRFERQTAREMKMQMTLQQREGLETRLLMLQGNAQELRRREILALEPANRGLLKQIWALEWAAKAAEKAAARQEELNRANESIARERYDLETRLLTLQGDTVALRERELALINPTNQALQKQIWALEDMEASLRSVQRVTNALNVQDFVSRVDFNRASALSGSGAVAGGAFVPAAPSIAMPANQNGGQDYSEMLRLILERLTRIEIDGQRRTTILRNWEDDGLPEERVA
jgi:TP901 family phage tail tape measure protein